VFLDTNIIQSTIWNYFIANIFLLCSSLESVQLVYINNKKQ